MLHIIIPFQNDAVNNLRKAKALYMTRQQEYDKARDITQRAEAEGVTQSSGGLTRAEKKKKLEDDAMHKVWKIKEQICMIALDLKGCIF